MPNDTSQARSHFVIEANDLTKIYGSGETRVEALSHVSASVERGQIIAVMGPSGSGKSTLLSLLGGLERPTSGQVLLEGVDLASLNDTDRTVMRRRSLGFVFQAFNLISVLTAIENVALPLELDGVSSSLAKQRATAALEQVGLQHRKDHFPAMMSGGEQQRVAIARALVIEPALILADEPTGNLDSSSGKKILELLRSLVSDRGETIVMVTHDAEIGRQADRVIHMCDGKLVDSNPGRRGTDDGQTGPSVQGSPDTFGTRSAESHPQ
jgi:putative ABC transport system ATP-binding protein